MEFMKLSKAELIEKCNQLSITNCKSKNKKDLIELINQATPVQNEHLKPLINRVQR